VYELRPATSARPLASSRAPTLGGALLGGIGALFVVIAAGMSAGAWRAKSWPTAPGVVTSSHVETRRGGNGGNVHLCKVSYRFTANGREHTGNRLRPMDVWSSGSGAREDEAAYRPGQAIRVHYDPSNPDDSVILAEYSIFLWIFGGIGGLLAAIGSCVLFAGWWRRRGPLE
jgi:hypothetical protein